MRAMWMALLVAACGDEATTTSGDTAVTTDTETTEPGPVTTSTGAARVATILGLTPDGAAGASTYALNCQACHGADGSGVAPNPALTDRVPGLTDEQVVTTILEGKGNMDSYKFLKNQDIANVVSHVRMSFDMPM